VGRSYGLINTDSTDDDTAGLISATGGEELEDRAKDAEQENDEEPVEFCYVWLTVHYRVI